MPETTDDFLFESRPADEIRVSRDWLRAIILSHRKLDPGHASGERYESSNPLSPDQIHFLNTRLQKSTESQDIIVVENKGFIHIFDTFNNRYVQISNLLEKTTPSKKDFILPGKNGRINLSLEPYTNDSLSFSATVRNEQFGFQLQFQDPKNAPTIFSINVKSKTAKLLISSDAQNILSLKKPDKAVPQAA